MPYKTFEDLKVGDIFYWIDGRDNTITGFKVFVIGKIKKIGDRYVNSKRYDDVICIHTEENAIDDAMDIYVSRSKQREVCKHGFGFYADGDYLIHIL